MKMMDLEYELAITVIPTNLLISNYLQIMIILDTKYMINFHITIDFTDDTLCIGL